MNAQLLIDSNAFWHLLQKGLKQARRDIVAIIAILHGISQFKEKTIETDLKPCRLTTEFISHWKRHYLKWKLNVSGIFL